MKMKLPEAALVLGVGIVVGLLISAKSNPFRGPKNSIDNSRNPQHKSAFFLGVTLKFNSVDDKEEFKALFAPYAKYVAEEEFGTISYELSESDKEPTQVFLTERYVNKDAYLEIHRKSKRFLEYRAKLTDMSSKFTMEGHSYIETNLGFM
jgi:quinol monooxygenase YgiN